MTKVCVFMLDLISVRVQSEREVEPRKRCSVLFAAVAIPTAVAIPKAAKHISRFMTVLPQSAATIRSRCISGMSPVIELVSFVSRRPETRVWWRTTCARQQCLGILAAVHESGNGHKADKSRLSHHTAAVRPALMVELAHPPTPA